MDVKAIQIRLMAGGYNIGKIDGNLGPKTYTGILQYVASRGAGTNIAPIATAMCPDFIKYEVNSPLRIVHFIAQACQETANWQYLTELGNDAYFSKYDGRKDLGNTVAGDGAKYRGRGIFQITGRYNYDTYGKRLGIDLINNPSRAAEPEIATLTACMYWSDHKLNALADADNCLGITKKINGGTNGLVDRQNNVFKLKALFSL